MPLHAKKTDRKHIINNFFRTKKVRKLDKKYKKCTRIHTGSILALDGMPKTEEN